MVLDCMVIIYIGLLGGGIGLYGGGIEFYHVLNSGTPIEISTNHIRVSQI